MNAVLMRIGNVPVDFCLLLAIAAAIGLDSRPAWAQPANDSCSSPTAISGNGTFNFNLNGATIQPGVGQDNTSCDTAAPQAITNDVWFCWTATCTGLAFIDTCGQTQVDTKIAFYPGGCACPGPGVHALCCNDDGCPPVPSTQSAINCEVVCCQTYLIQIGTKPGTPPGVGTFTISCQGTACPQPCGGEPPPPKGECCGVNPAFLGPLSPNFVEVVAAATHDRACANDYVVHVVDLKNQASAPPIANWTTPFFNPATACPAGPPTHATWRKGHLGTVFGVAIDDVGNIYVGHTAVYGRPDNPVTDALGVGGAGAIYKIDTNTAVAAQFNTTPIHNFPDPSITPASESLPGLGNLAFSCEHQMLYASNFEDGRIYRLNTSGVILSTYDHTTGAVVAGNAVEPGDPPGFVAATERIWAVQPHGDRLYYSIWAGGAQPIWSVGLTGPGDFIPGSKVQESFSGAGFGVHQPVADITFSPTGTMFTAERTMSSNTMSGAHNSRLLEWVFNSGSSQWDPSGNTFKVGVIGNQDNTAGGVDFDFFNNKVFATGDALQFGNNNPVACPCNPCAVIYGLQGLPATGGSVCNSILIDMDQNTAGEDKYQQGSVEVSCLGGPCVEITDKRLTCVSDPVGKTGFRKDFNVTNNTAVPIQYLLVVVPPPVTVTPNVITFNPPIPPGGTESVNLLFGGMEAGELTCFTMTFLDEDVQECCTIEQCVKPCLQITTESLTCAGAPGRYNYTFILTNLLNEQVEHIFLIPPSGSGITFTPNYFDVPTLSQCGQVVLQTVVNVPAGVTDFCYLASAHNQSLQECCGHDECISLPDCANDSPSDVNNDGAVNVDDLLIVLNHWGPCPPPCPADANGNGLVDVDDLLMLINDWG